MNQVTNIDTFLKENFQTMGAASVAKLLTNQGLKTPRGKTISAGWVSNRAQTIGVYKAGRGKQGANLTKRREARMAKPAVDTFRPAVFAATTAELAGIIANAKVSKAMKLAMFNAIV